jgi:MOSC domain-containing protein YiiM
MAEVVAVAARATHRLAKDPQLSIRLITGEGVAGDAHCGVTVKHRSRVAKDPTLPNLRQVHLIHQELLAEIAEKGFTVGPGEIGENILTRGVDLLGLATGTKLSFPSGAALEITGLRNPCSQLNGHSPGLMDALIDRDGSGNLIRRGGVMAIVLAAGEIFAGDAIKVEPPPLPHRALGPV